MKLELILILLVVLLLVACEESSLVVEETLTIRDTIIGNVTYEKTPERYYVLAETEGVFSEIMKQNLQPFIDDEHYSNIYEENDQIEKLLTDIDPNYKDNINRELTDQEIWAIAENLFDWLIEHSTKNDVHTDIVSQAEHYSDSGKVNMGACVQTSGTNYILLLRLGVPRNKIAVANIVGNKGINKIVDGKKTYTPVANTDVEKLISQGRIKHSSELPNFIANSGGHYYAIINIGDQWFHIEESCINHKWDGLKPNKYICTNDRYANPHRIFIAPKKENCKNNLELGCQDAPLGVPLLSTEK